VTIKKSVYKVSANSFNHYAQQGEDGALEYVLSRLPSRDKWLVEFGAWDGKFLSNGFHLIKNLGYNGVLIEMDHDRFLDLEKNMREFRVDCIEKMVGVASENNLDSILLNTRLPHNFDLLSIDVDGNDIHIWRTIEAFKPKVVIIEINARKFPGEIDIHDPESQFELFVSGSSISSITELAQTKGYSLIANIGCNAIYVEEKYYSIFYDEKITEFDLFTYEAFHPRELNMRQFIQFSLFKLARPNRTKRIFKLVLRKTRLKKKMF
jgi:hypothetical protein